MFDYDIVKSRRAKWMRIDVFYNGIVKLTVPFKVDKRRAALFINSKRAWVLKKLEFYKNYKGPIRKRGSGGRGYGRLRYQKNKDRAQALVIERLEYFNRFYNFKWGRVSIKNQKRRWGSCSRKGNLNFNHRLAELPAELSDYIVVHELCHLKELNHSKDFWKLVSIACPKYRECRSELKNRNF
jgi:predicted metal-dependent hydrolase